MDSRLDMTTRNILCQQFSEELVNFIELLVKRMEEDLGCEIIDPYYINIVTHLLIMIIRIMKGQRAEKEAIKLDNSDLHKMRVVIKAVNSIEERYSIYIPDGDIAYIYEHLESMGYGEQTAQLAINKAKFDDKTKKFVVELVESLSEQYNTNSFDNKAMNYILLHIHSMLARLKYGITIKCPLLDEIKENYSALFENVKINLLLCLKKYYPNYIINEDEIAYVTVYFQTIKERDLKKHIRVIVVCSSSVGTSHMLMQRVKNKHPNWEIVDQLPASRLNKLINNYEGIDLILSTVRIQNYLLKIPLATVSVMFNERDEELVRKVLEGEEYGERN